MRLGDYGSVVYAAGRNNQIFVQQENGMYTPSTPQVSGHRVVDVGNNEYAVNRKTNSIDVDALNRDVENQKLAYITAQAKGDKAGMKRAAEQANEDRKAGATLASGADTAATKALKHYYEQSGIKVAISTHSVAALNKGILQAKNDYAWAKAHNDQAGMAAAAQLATNMRALGGTIGASASLADAQKTVKFETQVSGHPVVDIGGSTFAVNKKTLTVDTNQLNREDEKRKIEYLNAQASGDTATMARIAKESLELQAAGATLKSGQDTPTTAALKKYYAQADIKDAISSKDTQKLNEAILKAKNDYTWAKEHNDVAGMDAASQLAANLRSLGGTIGANVSLQDASKMIHAAKLNTSSTTTPKQLPSTSADTQQSDVSYSQDHAQLLEAFKQFYMAQKPDTMSDKDKAESADDDMKYLSGLTNQQLYDRLQDLTSKNELVQYYANVVQQPGFDSKTQWKKDPGYQQFVISQTAQNEGPAGIATGMMFVVGAMKSLAPKYSHDAGGASGGNATGNQPADNTESVQENQGADSNDSTANGTEKVFINNGKLDLAALEANPELFSGKSVDEIAQTLKEHGYDVTVQASTKSRSGAQIIRINNPGNGRDITQVQVSPGGGRHGANPYVKVSTSDQGIIKVVDGSPSAYKSDGNETATIIFTGR